MPDKKTLKAAAKDKREGKAASTQAGEFVKEEMDHIREGKHGAKSAKQAIAIGLSKARRAGVALKPQKGATAAQKKADARATAKGKAGVPIDKKRSAASEKALKKESTRAASATAISREVKSAAKKSTAADRSAAAKKAAVTKGAKGRSDAAKKAAKTKAKK